ncbi:hypothetical protein JTE90_006316 [Oedothorax gibbosus]|uniref:Myb/SANT-like DNA-binding domain-containing protein n=1 Tax=Oedothorax gibbosus TaxID=931172 RepID=A0AAV6U2I5_9ARAC|nr:hypothetical protein JTE90_006316 [Oedothorax gibbosus]
MIMASKDKPRRRNWGDPEIQLLIDVWRVHNASLLSARRNRHVYDQMAQELALYGIVRTHDEIALKIKNLTATYRKEKTLQGVTGGQPSEWRFFNDVSAILDQLPCNTNSLVQDSLFRNHGSDDPSTSGYISKENERMVEEDEESLLVDADMNMDESAEEGWMDGCSGFMAQGHLRPYCAKH